MLDIVEEFSSDIGMWFGLHKYRINNILRGNMQPESFQMQDGESIETMERLTNAIGNPNRPPNEI